MSQEPNDGRAAPGQDGWLGRIAAKMRVHQRDASAPQPAGEPADIEVDGPASVRVLLFGTAGPDAVRSGDPTLARSIAERLAAATGRGVLLDQLVAERWRAPDPIRALERQRLERYDAVLIMSTYRSAVIDVPVDRWLGQVVEVRDLVLRSVREGTPVQVLNLPWQQAAVEAPAAWGGPLGRHIRTLDRLATASLDSAPGALRLTLSSPETAAEWVGPAFSADTYRRWGSEVSRQLSNRLGT